MSAPFVYTPSSQYSGVPFVTTYYTTTQSSPFIPDAALYPYSPYTSPFKASTPLPSISPHLSQSPLPDVDEPKYPKWTSLRPQARKRTLSLNSGANQYLDPHVYSTPAVATPFTPPVTLADNRRRSFGSYGNMPPPLYYSIWGHWQPYFPVYQGPVPPTQFLIHPYLNSQAPRLDFFFDLATPTFSPMRLLGPIQATLLTSNELAELATYPSLTRLRIVCDLIPSWPIDLKFQGVGSPLPITVGDVLSGIHSHLQQRITHVDWAWLDKEQELRIAKAYTKRCKNAGSVEMMERANGVKRVDYLLGKVRFKGLHWVGDGNVKLVLG